MKKYITIIMISANLLFMIPVSAQITGATVVDGKQGLYDQEWAAQEKAGYGGPDLTSSLQRSIGRIINYVAGLIGTFLLVIIAYGGFEWMSAAGNDDQVTKAKESIQRAIVGALILLAAYAITQFVVGAIIYSTQRSVMNASDSTGWSNINPLYW